MDKIFKLLNLPADKANHAFWLTFAFSIMIALGIASQIEALGVVAVTAAIKEVYDYLNQDTHTADVFDFVAGVMPSIIITGMHFAFR